MDGEQKKQFNFPKRQELVDMIKQLDDDIEHVSLNLIKCDFAATEKDVEKTFPQYQFVKIKNYNPGSFEVIFELKIDAINFIRKCFDRKILARRFFIKLGRQHKQVLEDWACVGNIKPQFNNQHRKNKPQFSKDDKQHHKETKNQDESEEKGEEKQKDNEQKEQKQEKVEKKQVPKKQFNVNIPEKKTDLKKGSQRKPEYKKYDKTEAPKQEKKTEQPKFNNNKEKQIVKAPQKEPKAEKAEQKQTNQEKTKTGQDQWITVPTKGKGKKK